MSDTKEPAVLTQTQLDQITAEQIAVTHLRTIWRNGDPGEEELVLMFFHLLHARRTMLDVDALITRRAEFQEHLDRVFAETGA